MVVLGVHGELHAIHRCVCGSEVIFISFIQGVYSIHHLMFVWGGARGWKGDKVDKIGRKIVDR